MKGLPRAASGKHRWQRRYVKFKRGRLHYSAELLGAKNKISCVFDAIDGSFCGVKRRDAGRRGQSTRS